MAVVDIGQQTLFERPIEGHQAFSNVVGRFCQILATIIVEGDFLDVNSTLPLNPDILLRDQKIAVESKASSTRQAFRVPVSQFNKYYELYQRKFYRVFYAFVEHGFYDGFRRLERKTIRCAMEALVVNLRYVVICDISFVYRLYQLARAHIGDDGFPVWLMFGREWPSCVKIAHALWRLFIQDPKRALVELGLDVRDFVFVSGFTNSMYVSGIDVPPMPIIYIYMKDWHLIRSIPDKLIYKLLVERDETAPDEEEPPY